MAAKSRQGEAVQAYREAGPETGRRRAPRHRSHPPHGAPAVGVKRTALTLLSVNREDGVDAGRPVSVSCTDGTGLRARVHPETNVLVPLDATADVSNTPASKSVVVRLEQSATD
ncbi:hypothetical protein STENM223S_08481 [Streptomyces tendae]